MYQVSILTLKLLRISTSPYNNNLNIAAGELVLLIGTYLASRIIVCGKKALFAVNKQRESVPFYDNSCIGCGKNVLIWLICSFHSLLTAEKFR